MELQEAKSEYTKALKLGQKQAKDLTARGLNPNPAVLDEILADHPYETVQDVGLVEIPADRIVGVKSAGRITAFSAGFMPLLDKESEFAIKWQHLCVAHMSDTGLRDPITCYEYLGNFYIQEGNKRVSVLRHFGAAKIPGNVQRILPIHSEEPRITAYYEFLEFYKKSHIYEVQFTKPGQYAELLAHLGKDAEEYWDQREQRTFTAYFQYFRDAYTALKGDTLDLHPEEALLLWLQAYRFQDLGSLSTPELRKTLAGLWPDVKTLADQKPTEFLTEPALDGKGSLLGRMLSTSSPTHLRVAFVHQRDPEQSPWVKAHDEGSQHLETVLPGKVDVFNYYHADTPDQAEELMELAAFEGADVVFTTTPQLSRATLKSAAKHPKVRYFNCSTDAPYSSTCSYYCRIYEAKFITGALAGAMAVNNRIGYIGSYPIFGVPASINAFALGAQLTNPRAKIELRWSCQGGNPVHEFMKEGIRVISNRDVPTPSRQYLEYGEYGTYYVADDYSLQPLGSPCWLWGKFYENVVRSILAGGLEEDRNTPVNYWWGMDSGVIDVKLSPKLSDGLQSLAQILRTGLISGTLDPFQRRIVAQDGTVVNDGTHGFTPEQVLHMNWLCHNVEGSIPPFEEVAPFAQAMVRELGLYRDSIPKEKEGKL